MDVGSIRVNITDDSLHGLEVAEIPGKGRGIKATRNFKKGEWLVEYAGEVITRETADSRDRQYEEEGKGMYLLDFTVGLSSTWYCIDATPESGRFGRLINHDRNSPNSKLPKSAVMVENKPRVILEATRDILEGEEILYDYGERCGEVLNHLPWMTSTGTAALTESSPGEQSEENPASTQSGPGEQLEETPAHSSTQSSHFVSETPVKTPQNSTSLSANIADLGIGSDRSLDVTPVRRPIPRVKLTKRPMVPPALKRGSRIAVTFHQEQSEKLEEILQPYFSQDESRLQTPAAANSPNGSKDMFASSDSTEPTPSSLQQLQPPSQERLEEHQRSINMALGLTAETSPPSSPLAPPTRRNRVIQSSSEDSSPERSPVSKRPRIEDQLDHLEPTGPFVSPATIAPKMSPKSPWYDTDDEGDEELDRRVRPGRDN